MRAADRPADLRRSEVRRRGLPNRCRAALARRDGTRRPPSDQLYVIGALNERQNRSNFFARKINSLLTIACVPF
jgi:hypothetical protein